MRFEEAYSPYRALKAAWRVMTISPLRVLCGGLLCAFTGILVRNKATSITHLPGYSEDDFYWSVACCGCLFDLVFIVAHTWVLCSFYLNTKSVVLTGKERAEGFFDVGDRFAPLLLSYFLMTIVQGVTLAIWFAPLIGVYLEIIPIEVFDLDLEFEWLLFLSGLWGLGFVGSVGYVWSGLAFTSECVVYTSASPVLAMKASWKLARGERWRIIWFSLVTGVVTLLGILLLCVGVLGTSAWTFVAWQESFLQVTRGKRLSSSGEFFH